MSQVVGRKGPKPRGKTDTATPELFKMDATMAPTMSLRAYARSRRERKLPGGTLAAVQKAVATKRISLLQDGRINPEVADREWERNIAPDARTRRDSAALAAANPEPAPAAAAPAEPPPPAKEPEDRSSDADPHRQEYSAARARREQFDAELAELKLRQYKGELISKADVEAAQETTAMQIREHLLNFPSRYSLEIANSLGAKERTVFRLLDNLVRRHLGEIIASLESQAA